MYFHLKHTDASRIWDNPYTGQVRLTGGTYSNQGVLEVYCNGQWGTVCDNGFGTTDARVACKQLGYSNYYKYDHLNMWVHNILPLYYLVFCQIIMKITYK